MNLNTVIRKVKDFFNTSTGRDRVQTPGDRLHTNHRPWAGRSGVSGNRGRWIQRYTEGRMKNLKFPFQPEIVESYRNVLSLPVLNEDGNRDKPSYDVLDSYDPGTISWDDY